MDEWDKYNTLFEVSLGSVTLKVGIFTRGMCVSNIELAPLVGASIDDSTDKSDAYNDALTAEQCATRTSSRVIELKGPDNRLAEDAMNQMLRYFDDPQYRFTLPLSMAGSAFRQRVWSALRKISAGDVRSYGQLARMLSSSARAVGGACRANPIPIIVPCHRVVAKSGVGGYGGAIDGDRLQIKRWLLNHESLSRIYLAS
jgi:methylated-DNA-[protein]-cysteine S-methyltransferase